MFCSAHDADIFSFCDTTALLVDVFLCGSDKLGLCYSTTDNPKSCKKGPFVVRSIQCVYKVKKIKTLCKKGIIDKNIFKERLNRLKTKEKVMELQFICALQRKYKGEKFSIELLVGGEGEGWSRICRQTYLKVQVQTLLQSSSS